MESYEQNRGGNSTGDKQFETAKRKDSFPHESRNRKQGKEDVRTQKRIRNTCAKRAREARKARELHTQLKAAHLERENIKILAYLSIVRNENVFLKQILFARMPR